MTGLPQALADQETADLAAVEVEFARQAQGAEPWTLAEYLDRVQAVHGKYDPLRYIQRKQAA
ncbi:hypothetical protein [Streptomyces sp. NPDC056387]|uniref:hypothetical protein n=1 Tax=Streptomyces sp. NPDC056387 TaxID=3345803 RepID=UPI0035DEA766